MPPAASCHPLYLRGGAASQWTAVTTNYILSRIREFMFKKTTNYTNYTKNLRKLCSVKSQESIREIREIRVQKTTNYTNYKISV